MISIPLPSWLAAVSMLATGACHAPPKPSPPEPSPPGPSARTTPRASVPQTSTEPGELRPTIRELKTGGQGWNGREVSVRGYFFSSTVPLLVDDPQRVYRNTPLPNESHLLLFPGDEPELELREGDLVEMTGRLRVTFEDWPDGSPSTIPKGPRVELSLTSQPVRIAGLDAIFPSLTPLPPHLLTTLLNIPDAIELVPTTRRRIALLVAGGYDLQSSYPRYWNNLKLLYKTLHVDYGIPASDIWVYFKDGAGLDNEILVDGPAVKSALKQAFADLAAEANANTDTFLYFGNHGGGAHLDAKVVGNVKGRFDLGGDETDEGFFETHLGSDLNGNGIYTDQFAYDECIFLYDTFDRIWDDDLRDWLTPVQGRIATVVQPCFGGGFLGDLAGPNRIVLSACSEFEYSHARADLKYDEFTYWFAAALAGREPDGTIANADKKVDQRISIAEAFEFAMGKDSQPETPWYEDDGDGRGRRTAFGAYDGKVGQGFFLDGKL